MTAESTPAAAQENAGRSAFAKMILSVLCGLVTTISMVAGGPAHATVPVWVPTWTASSTPAARPYVTIENLTVRQIVHTSAGGRLVRIRLSNAYGAKPVHLDAVAIALRDRGDEILLKSAAKLLFFGGRGVTIGPGASVESDPLPFPIPAQGDLAISYFVAGQAEATTWHSEQRSAVYFGEGDQTSEATVATAAQPATADGILWLDEVEVADSSATKAVVAFGDSLTDGHAIPPDSSATWPDALYDRLRKAGIETVAVANAGVSGNRLLHDGGWPPMGVAGLSRFKVDVLDQPNASAVIVAIGLNDIAQVPSFAPASEHVSPEQIERGLSQLARSAHGKGLKIYVCTLTPFRDTTIPVFSEKKEADREAVNQWIRASRLFDGVADFAKALEDPAHIGKLRPAYDSGDHAHPNAAGDRAIADTIPLSWFR